MSQPPLHPLARLPEPTTQQSGQPFTCSHRAGQRVATRARKRCSARVGGNSERATLRTHYDCLNSAGDASVNDIERVYSGCKVEAAPCTRTPLAHFLISKTKALGHGATEIPRLNADGGRTGWNRRRRRCRTCHRNGTARRAATIGQSRQSGLDDRAKMPG